MVASLRVSTIIKEYRKLDIRIKYIEHLMKNHLEKKRQYKKFSTVCSDTT
jgi:hypothetical protein